MLFYLLCTYISVTFASVLYVAPYILYIYNRIKNDSRDERFTSILCTFLLIHSLSLSLSLLYKSFKRTYTRARARGNSLAGPVYPEMRTPVRHRAKEEIIYCNTVPPWLALVQIEKNCVYNNIWMHMSFRNRLYISLVLTFYNLRLWFPNVVTAIQRFV